MEQSFDIQTPSQQTTTHHSRRTVVIVSIIVIIIGAILIGLHIKAKRAHDAYLRTPQGQLQALEATSEPVTATQEERYDEAMKLQQTSGQTTQAEGLAALKALE